MLPDWLPDSMVLAEPEGKILLQVKYRLMVQLRPSEANGYVADIPELGISKVRHERPILINRGRAPQPQLNFKQDLESKVGGFLGIGRTHSKA